SLSAACERHQVPMVATELGGGARLDRSAFEIGLSGTRNLLRHAGVLHGAPEATRTALHLTAGADAYLMAPVDGLFEGFHDLGTLIEAGQAAGRIWPMDDLTREPVPVSYGVTGRILCVRTMPMVRRGDFLLHTGAPMGDADFLETNPA
ncbi:MAG TPA: succinylglutamate desuccinylase/aspartoacylase family protein, partial [Beijerinckiaceae bacterium]|nr:succinylglutamate desuccinylase/aspartoacylase family protein [Beijerinckiaceae bacterium]